MADYYFKKEIKNKVDVPVDGKYLQEALFKKIIHMKT